MFSQRYGVSLKRCQTKTCILWLVSWVIVGYSFVLASFWPRRILFGYFRGPHIDIQKIQARCTFLKAVPSPPHDFLEREISDRFEPGTTPTLIRNATIWTGKDDGTEVVHGDILLENGLVRAIGQIPAGRIVGLRNATVVNAQRGWITPGLVDLHSNVGLLSAPAMAGAWDVDSPNGPVLPWLRSIDGFNTHDDAFRLAIAGGVTSMQAQPGSANVIGGQAFMVKPRRTSERSPSSMVIEPPFNLNGSRDYAVSRVPWRHMKQACGEDVRHRHGTRMDIAWALRFAYNEARKIKLAQDVFCSKVEADQWESLGSFPESAEWEALVDVLRGRVKVSSHCSEVVDLDTLVRISNEFEFPIASLHQAAEAWIIPDALNRTWGGTPVIALSVHNHREQRQTYRGSEHAARVLADNGIPVAMTSHHPVLNSRYLLYEAQQAHYYNLPPHLALSSVTSVPAAAAGLSHRIGILREGADADVVLWDSHPLQLGATPVNVWIDGILQIPVPEDEGGPRDGVLVGKGKEAPIWREVPVVPDWDLERKEAVRWEGLPPLKGRVNSGRVIFQNVKELWTRTSDGGILEVMSANAGKMSTVVVEKGRILRVTDEEICFDTSAGEKLDLHGGSIVPGLMTFGSPLGLEEIASEPSTGDGRLYDAFTSNVPLVLGDPGGIVRAVDGLRFETRNALLAHRSGVTTATSSLHRRSFFGGSSGVIGGLSAVFRTGSAHVLETGAVVQEVAALHVAIGRPWHRTDISVSQTITGLRRLLEGWERSETETGLWFGRAARGIIPLVVDVSSADIMAALLGLKTDIEDRFGSTMRMVFSGATEAHLLASEISNAGVGVILKPLRPYPATWSESRILGGPPLTNDTTLVKLLEHKVTVGVGVREAWAARNTRFDLIWAAMESNGRLTKRDVYELASTNLESLVGLQGVNEETADLAAYDGGSPFEWRSKAVAVISPRRGVVDFIT